MGRVGLRGLGWLGRLLEMAVACPFKWAASASAAPREEQRLGDARVSIQVGRVGLRGRQIDSEHGSVAQCPFKWAASASAANVNRRRRHDEANVSIQVGRVGLRGCCKASPFQTGNACPFKWAASASAAPGRLSLRQMEGQCPFKWAASASAAVEAAWERASNTVSIQVGRVGLRG